MQRLFQSIRRSIADRFQTSGLRTSIVYYLETYPSLQAVPYWLAAFVVGLIAVTYGLFFHYLTDLAKYLVTEQPLVLFTIAPFCFLCASWLVRKYAPAAAGSGIPQVMAAIELEAQSEEKKIQYLLGVKTLGVKVLSSFLCVIGGGAIGPEGPTVQISAGLFHYVGIRFRRIWPQIGHQSLIVAGGAAGVAAAFNTPLGGIVFAIEELSHQHFIRFKTVLISAVIVAGLVAQWIVGPYLFFGYPIVHPVAAGFLPWAIGIGIICGTSGAFFCRAVLWGSEFLRTVRGSDRILYSLWVGLAMAAMGYFGSPYILGGGTELIADLLFKGEVDVSWGLLVGRILGPLICYIEGCAAGLLAPSLTAGAVIGRKLAELSPPENTNLFILLGMIGFLSAVTRAPFTAFVLVLEMTDRHSAIFPMMLASIVATGTARVFDSKSFYETRKEYYKQVAESLAPPPTPPPLPEPPVPPPPDSEFKP